MADIWASIKQLEGKTISTAARKKEFKIDRVDNDLVVYTLQSTGKVRSSLRATFEQIVGLGLKQHELTRRRIEEEVATGDERNSSYVYAILCAVGKAV
jgi:hypothetical protein